MSLDLARTLDRVQERQWALADIDWDAPGAERITDEQRPKLAAFMADVGVDAAATGSIIDLPYLVVLATSRALR